MEPREPAEAGRAAQGEVVSKAMSTELSTAQKDRVSVSLAVAKVVGAVVVAIVAEGALGANWGLLPAAVMQVCFLVVAITSARPSPALGLRLVGSAPRSAIVAGILGTLGLSGLAAGTTALLGIDRTDVSWSAGMAAFGPGRLTLTLLVLGPLTGLGEEVFFRGFMQTELARRWGQGRALLATSAVFGLAHFNLVQSSAAFLMGLWLGLVADRTRTIRPSICAHVVNNLVTLTSALWLLRAGATWRTGFCLTATSLVLLAAAVALLARAMIGSGRARSGVSGLALRSPGRRII
jgi:membrane protease YdiL (CAAX protease family)